MDKLIFEVRDAQEGGYHARALGQPIFTQATTWDELKSNVLEAVECFYDRPEEQPALIQLHYVRDELLVPGAA